MRVVGMSMTYMCCCLVGTSIVCMIYYSVHVCIRMHRGAKYSSHALHSVVVQLKCPQCTFIPCSADAAGCWLPTQLLYCLGVIRHILLLILCVQVLGYTLQHRVGGTAQQTAAGQFDGRISPCTALQLCSALPSKGSSNTISQKFGVRMACILSSHLL